MQPHQKINHFPGMSTLSRKNNLAKNILRMQSTFPDHYHYSPRTFLLPYEANLLKNYVQDGKRRGSEYTFIVKPEAGCQGRGIYLTQNLNGTAR
jgi:tubulin polyglutamylase TTLL6/13